MQNIEILRTALENLSDENNYLFSIRSFHSLFPKLSRPALAMLLSRAAAKGILSHICKGYYLYQKANYERGYELFQLAAHLREGCFCYLSLENILSEAGIISQIPLNYASFMTNGRSGKINCGNFGIIEFVHTKKNISALSEHLVYERKSKIWKADVCLAYKDMVNAKRPLDLINEEILHEFI